MILSTKAPPLPDLLTCILAIARCYDAVEGAEEELLDGDHGVDSESVALELIRTTRFVDDCLATHQSRLETAATDPKRQGILEDIQFLREELLTLEALSQRFIRMHFDLPASTVDPRWQARR